jgi:hypothetical protein
MGREAYIPTRTRSEIEAETARLILNLKQLPIELLRILSGRQLITLFNPNLSHETVLKFRQEILKKREGEMTGKGINQPDPATIGAQVVIEQLAGVAAKTYANLGDREKLGSEDALRLINKILKEYDPTILDRNLRRRLPK